MMTLEFWQTNDWLVIFVIAAFFAMFGPVWKHVFGAKAKRRTYFPVQPSPSSDRSMQGTPRHIPAE
jgi:hypothetical protein